MVLGKQDSAVAHLVTAVYLAGWGIVAYFSYRNYGEEDDPISRFYMSYQMFMGCTKVVSAILALFLLGGTDGTCFVTTTKIIMVVTILVDLVPTLLVGYKGIVFHDPLSFMVFIQKAVDTLLLWYMCSINGSIIPCYCCSKSKNVQQEEKATEEVELENFAN